MKHLKTFLWCFVIILIVELIVVSNPEWLQFRILTKPMVVISILVFFLIQQVDKKTRLLVTTALLFSLVGDIQLIYSGDSDMLFLGGVSAFLVAHIMYIIQFSRTRNRDIGYLAPLLVLSVYALSMYWYLSDSLNNMAIPVGVYIVVYLAMILSAYLRDDSMTDNSYICVLSGALLFMLSDSIVAITRFKSDIPYSGALVMGIYGTAQLLMVLGILKGATSNTYERQFSLSSSDRPPTKSH